eukprot:1395249-Amorphochlora_amoeboformis.AAC.1
MNTGAHEHICGCAHQQLCSSAAVLISSCAHHSSAAVFMSSCLYEYIYGTDASKRAIPCTRETLSEGIFGHGYLHVKH